MKVLILIFGMAVTALFIWELVKWGNRGNKNE
jgi:hypothetical protein